MRYTGNCSTIVEEISFARNLVKFSGKSSKYSRTNQYVTVPSLRSQSFICMGYVLVSVGDNGPLFKTWLLWIIDVHRLPAALTNRLVLIPVWLFGQRQFCIEPSNIDHYWQRSEKDTVINTLSSVFASASIMISLQMNAVIISENVLLPPRFIAARPRITMYDTSSFWIMNGVELSPQYFSQFLKHRVSLPST